VNNKHYKIAYFEVDESRVHVYKIPQHGIRGEVDDFTYPLAGEYTCLYMAMNLRDI